MASNSPHPSLIAGHAAVAMLALAALDVAPVADPHLRWGMMAQQVQWVAPGPRRLPTSRRTDRALSD